MINTICKNIAFSSDGKCLMGNGCLCDKNKLWLEDSTPSVQPIEYTEVPEEKPDKPISLRDLLPTRASSDVQPIDGEQKPEWIEATTPPEKEGFYNVITFENIPIVTSYQYGRWEYDMEAGGSDAPDWVVRYRPSSHQPLSAPALEPQPIADKGVPEAKGLSAFDIGAWAAEETKDLAQRDKDFFYMGCGQLFQELKGHFDAQSIQIAGLLASNKEWGEKYAESCRQQEEAKNLIEGFVRIWRAEGNKGVAPKNITNALKFLAQFPQPPKAEK